MPSLGGLVFEMAGGVSSRRPSMNGCHTPTRGRAGRGLTTSGNGAERATGRTGPSALTRKSA